jgi:hypothetical protein
MNFILTALIAAMLILQPWALTTAGKTLIAARLVGTSLAAVDASNGYICVGDSSTAFSAAHTDLQAASNKFRKLLNGAPGLSGADMTFVAVFGSSEANFPWLEMGIFNHASAGTMLCRKVIAQGTKASGQVWTYTVVVTVG